MGRSTARRPGTTVPDLYAIFVVVGLGVFAYGMSMWSHYRRGWHDSLGIGLAVGGLVLLVAGCAMAPGWS